MLAMVANDNAGYQASRVDLRYIASMLAPTKGLRCLANAAGEAACARQFQDDLVADIQRTHAHRCASEDHVTGL